MPSATFDASRWEAVPGFSFSDISYHRAKGQGTVRIAFSRPEVRNAFRPKTVDELFTALDHARQTSDVGTVLLTGNGPSPKDGGWAFCSGGDQRIRGKVGYQYQEGEGAVDAAKLGRLHILEVQRLIRFMPKVVIAVVNGWCVGGGHSLHVVCDLTLASEEHAKFKQTDADVASFDGGYGSAYLARMVGQKRAREIFFLGRTYSAREAFEMGMANAVVPHADLERVEPVRLGGKLSQIVGKPVRADTTRQQLRRARLRFAEFLVEEIAQGLETAEPDRIQEELIALGLYEHIRDVLPDDWKSPS